MLNKNNERELAYLAKVTAIAPMDAERLETIYINGWTCVAGKGEFAVGDIGVFFEPDSKLPEVEPFTSIDFLAKKNYKIKPQKIRGVISQGLFVPLTAFGWLAMFDEETQENVGALGVGGKLYLLEDDSKFLTSELGVTYEVAEDNSRKAPSIDKYKKMVQRRPEIFKHKWAQWFMRRTWGKKLMFLFFGKKKDQKTGWPAWVVKTDEERCQNMPWLFPEGGCPTRWIATEKIDGTSTTFTMKGFGRKREFYVCSRNVVFDKPDKKCFYETNVYTEMAEKYKMEEALAKALDMEHEKDSDVEFVTIQGETYGGEIQKRKYGDTHNLAIFNIIIGKKDGTTRRLNPIEMSDYLLEIQPLGAPTLSHVPIVDTEFYLPATCDELLVIAHGTSALDDDLREGLVFRSCDGVQSFKAVDPEFLLKYHG